MEKEHNPLSPQEESLRFVVRFYRKGKNDTSAAWKRVCPLLAPKENSSRLRRLYRITGAAAVVAGLAAGAFAYYWNCMRTDWITVTAGVENRKLVLPDRSEVTLSAGGVLRYDRLAFGKDGRKVSLKGKAFFSVSRCEDEPFSVTAPVATVQVLGTRFQVEAAPDSAVAFVTSGRVRFRTSRQWVDLVPGQRAVGRSDGAIRTGKPENQNELAWMTGRLTYRNTPLKQVVKELEKVYRVRIEGVPQSELYLTSDFNRMEIADIIHIINQTLDTNLRIKP